VQAMDTLRAAINAVSGNNGRIFAFGSQWLNYEQYKSITSEAIRNISITLAACFVIIAMLVIEIKTVVSVSLALTMIFVDDMFVIVNSYDNTEARVDPVERMGRSLRVAGMSITVTSATDVIAFLIGSSTSLPALKNFCFYAALGIFFDYLYQITFFTAFLSIDERRKSENKADCFFCLDCPPEACCVCCTPKKMPKSLLQIALGDGLGKQLGKKPVKIFVLAFFSAITVGGIIGSTKMQVDADVNNFIPDGSYLKNWFADTDAYFTEYGDAVEVYSKSTLDLTTEDSILRTSVARTWKRLAPRTNASFARSRTWVSPSGTVRCPPSWLFSSSAPPIRTSSKPFSSSSSCASSSA